MSAPGVDNHIRVLQVTGTLFIGGAEKVIAILAKENDRRRIETAVCCTHKLGPLADVIRASGVPVTLAGGGRRSRYLRGWDIRQIIAQFRPHVIHTHGLQGMFQVGPLAMLRQVPHWIHTFHYGNYPYANKRYMRLERFFSRWVDQLVAVAEPQRRAVIAHHGVPSERIITLHNGVPSNPFVNDPDVRRQKREELGVAQDAFVIGTVAVLTEQKGLEFLIDAASRIRQILPAARVVIVGSGILNETLRATVKARGLDDVVLFTGWRSDVAALLASMDVFVMSSLWEAMPLALLEAMAAGRPIVVTDVGDNRRIVQNGAAATLVPPRDSAALASAFIEIAQSPVLGQTLGARARQAFEDHFTEAQMVSRYERLYRQGSSRTGHTDPAHEPGEPSQIQDAI